MTFHNTAKTVVSALNIQKICQLDVSPKITLVMGPEIKTRNSDGPLPIRAEILGPRIPPNVPPIAPAVPSSAKTKTEVLSISCAKRMKTAAVRAPIPLRAPRMIAIGRSNSWRHSHPKPSFISARKFNFSLFLRFSTGRSEGTSVAMSPAEIKKVVAST